MVTKQQIEYGGWRLLALERALFGGNFPYSLLLHDILQVMPEAVVTIFSCSRLETMTLLQQRGIALSPLVPTDICTIGEWNRNRRSDAAGEVDERTHPYCGWYEVDWQGATIEMIFVPGANTTDTICFGANRELVDSFILAILRGLETPTGRCLRYSDGWEGAPELEEEIGKVRWSDIVLPEQLLDDIRGAVDGFFKSRDAYHSLGFAWKRGILLIGPPGTGKTMICKATAGAHSDLPFLYVRDIRAYHGQDTIRAIFERARKLTPCILAFEDVDGMIDHCNRTVFLNELDGFRSNDGLLVIASSNHPGQIDEALLKRPSRFDRVYHIGLPAFEERREYCLRVLAGPVLAKHLPADLDIEDLATQVAMESDGFTPAYIKEAFVSAALYRVQEGSFSLTERFDEDVLFQIAELRGHLQSIERPGALAEMHIGGEVSGW